MSKIKKLISTVWNKTDSNEHIYDIYVSEIEDLMKSYAEYYAKKCLEIAADNATGTPIYDYSNPYTAILLEDKVNIDVDSILNIKLPEHE